MTEVTVTRGSQITLKKGVREKLGIEEGDTVTVNVNGDQIIITKKDPEAFETEGFLSEDFEKVMEDVRKDSTDRLEKVME